MYKLITFKKIKQFLHCLLNLLVNLVLLVLLILLE